MKLIRIIVLLFLGCSYAGAAIIMQPYLQAMKDSSVYVLAESDNNTQPVTVEYGLTSSYGQSAAVSDITATTGGTYVYRTKISSLLAGTKYYYRVSQASSMPYSGASFTTLPAAGSGFRFAWLADCRSGPDIFNTITGRIMTAAPLFSLYGGDLSVDGTYTAYKNEFFVANQLLLSSVSPFYNSMGNHEKYEQNTIAFTYAPDSDSNTTAYYSFDAGDVHVLVLNYLLPYDTASAQYAFALSDLAASDARWNIVTFHSPAYCGGSHGEDAQFKQITTNIFEPNNVDMVLSGHSHFFQHNYVNGIHHMIIGASGSPLHDPVAQSYTVAQAKSQCYAVFDADSASLTVNVYNDAGQILDSFALGQPVSFMKHPAENLSSVYAYPSKFEATKGHREIIFGKLTRYARLSVFTLSGEVVYTEANSGEKESITWQVPAGLASGIYLFTVTDENKRSVKGKIAIIK